MLAQQLLLRMVAKCKIRRIFLLSFIHLVCFLYLTKYQVTKEADRYSVLTVMIFLLTLDGDKNLACS